MSVLRTPSIPETAGRQQWGNLPGAALALAIAGGNAKPRGPIERARTRRVLALEGIARGPRGRAHVQHHGHPAPPRKRCTSQSPLPPRNLQIADSDVCRIAIAD